MTEPNTSVPGTEAPSAKAPGATLRLGFARGIAPSKWADRWGKVQPAIPLELVPLDLAFGGPKHPESCDVVIERAAPGQRPAGSSEAETSPLPSRHAIRLYTEAIALVVDLGHNLAKRESVTLQQLASVTLLDHPDHSPEWPAAEPWQDPAWMPKDAAAALELVAAGSGAILLPQPLARHITDKHQHAVLRVSAPLAGSTVWASWAVARDAADVQQLIGVMRGRTARSSRPAAVSDGAAEPKPRVAQQKPAKKPVLKANSRGAQLAAAREKIERAKAEKRKAARRKRR
ncbi:LysR family transcriptional regulator [Leucobacter insecticola]|uniref:LysR family transcriptional regulator n=1 Tax=Leucobacter insecticola TaxID=2714934 RepID=A0A6G8FFR5_9MICO|nr:LysR substrate-binding domain-containing protein [Leucobacter insecticola]QIM15174.1 LysR family transcriptional regulator [Leucobacter insecticola]